MPQIDGKWMLICPRCNGEGFTVYGSQKRQSRECNNCDDGGIEVSKERYDAYERGEDMDEFEDD